MIDIEFSIDRLEQISHELGATPQDIEAAKKTAIRKTARTIMVQSRKYLREGLSLRNSKTLKRRLRLVRARQREGVFVAGVWAGSFPMPVGAFKGRMRQTARGATHNGMLFPGSFVAKMKSGKRSVFKRRSKRRLPIHEQEIPVHKDAGKILEAKVYPLIDDVFYKNFRRELIRRAARIDAR